MYYILVYMCVFSLQFLQDTGDFQQAEQILNKVVQIEPENPLGHFSLGCVNHYRMSDMCDDDTVSTSSGNIVYT